LKANSGRVISCGVATVVAKLFNIVGGSCVLRRKRRAAVGRHPEDGCGSGFSVSIVPVATVREPDGLAMSSRKPAFDS
jgi:pantothenate synthetase